jgi:hypothetical protein
MLSSWIEIILSSQATTMLSKTVEMILLALVALLARLPTVRRGVVLALISLISLISLIIIIRLARISIYRRWYSPLGKCRIPGPFLFSISRLPLVYYSSRGLLPFKILELHNR